MPFSSLCSYTALAACSLFPLLVTASSGNSAFSHFTNLTQVVETSVITGTGNRGVVTEFQTFYPTTYPGFANLKSTIRTSTLVTIVDRDSTNAVTKTLTYDYVIGPGGLGWTIPTPLKDEPILAQPTTLPRPVQSTSRSGTSGSVGSTGRVTTRTSPTTTGRTTTGSTTSSTSTDASTSTLASTLTSTSRHTSMGTSNGALNGTSTGTSSHTSTRTSNSHSTSTPISTPASDTSGTTTRTSTSSSTRGSSSTSSSRFTTSTDIITSTITSGPAGFTGFTLEGTTYTANDWITTTDSNHHTTLLPLILLGGGRGVIFWNLPPIPHVEFSFPSFPKFHLPCVKVFGVSVGSCTSPPDSDGPPPKPPGSNPDDPNDPSNPDDPTDPDDPDGSTTTQPTSRSTSTSSTTLESSCTAQTVSDCTVRCASTASNSCASYSTACTRTTGSCSARGTTTTITTQDACIATPAQALAQATQTFCGGKCSATDVGDAVPPYTTSDLDTSQEFRKRAIAGRITMNPLMKRANPSPIRTLGGCPLATPNNLPLVRPGWPGIEKMLNAEKDGTMDDKYKVISRYDRATKDDCVFTTTRLGASEFLNAPTWQDYLGNNYKDENNRGSLDHAYEKDWLKLFFNQAISSTGASNALTCDQTTQYFFPCGSNLLRDIWTGIAGDDNLKFVAMSQYVNGVKATFFLEGKSFSEAFVGDSKWLIPSDGSQWVWPGGKQGKKRKPPYSAQDGLNIMIGYFEKVLYGVLEMKTDNMLKLIDATNNDIYGKLLSLDEEVSKNQNSMFGNTDAYHAAFPNGLAGNYKDFMSANIEPKINAPPQYLTKLFETVIWPGLSNAWKLPDVETDSTDSKKPGQYREAYFDIYNVVVAQKKHYQNNNAWSWDYEFSFSWQRPTTSKHDVFGLLKRADACTRSVGSTTTSTTTGRATTTTTSRRTTTSSSSIRTTTFTPSTTTTKPPVTSCSFVTTIFPTSQSIVSGVQRYCTCGDVMAGINMATSGTSTTTYCALGSPVPTGFMQIPVINGLPVIQTTTTSTTTATPAPPTSTSATPCVGNQVQGSCVQAELPAGTPNSGIKSPVCLKVGTHNYVRFNADQASKAASTYCNNLVSGKVVLNDKFTTPNVARVNGAAEHGGFLALNVLFDVDACDLGTAPDNQKVDFAAMGLDKCYQYLYTALADSCSEDDTWSGYDAEHTLQGGVWGGGCALWAMTGLSV